MNTPDGTNELAVREDNLRRQMSAFYEKIDATIAAHKPTCWNRGLCCKFGAYGHRLYVTRIELDYFVSGMRDRWIAATEEDTCPYQAGGVCTAREHRPLGCRIFFCDENARHWQQDAYEAGLTELKQMMAGLDIDYQYVEWLSALRNIEPGPRTSTPNGPDHASPQSPGSVDPYPLPVIQ